MLFHGAIHLLGFVKAFGFAKVEQLNGDISRVAGVFWLLAFLFFLVASIAFLAKADWWFIVATIAVIISTILISISWSDAKFGTIANIIILFAIVIGYGTWNFAQKYKKEVITDLSHASATPASLLTEKDIEVLPQPVQKYIRYAGAIGKPKVNNFKIEFIGKIRKDEQSKWMTFTTEQYNFLEVTHRLFFMKAVMKGLPVAGFHCFKNGTAYMDIRLFSLFKVQYMDGKEMGISETVTFFNDMCCMAPATLIDKRIKWLEVKDNKVRASFSNNGITISAWLYFNDKGELINFTSSDRYAAGENNSMKQLPWSTPLKDYKAINGYNLAGFAEAVYTYPTGDLCYGTFSITNIEYNCIK